MKTPPLLIGAALAFWGWQTGFLIPGIIMGLSLEAARIVRARWEFSDDDLHRIWNLCLGATFAAAIYAFNANEGPAEFRDLFHNPGFMSQHGAQFATARTTMSVLRWLPMIFFCFVLAQTYSPRASVPLHVISFILRHRLKTARKLGAPAPVSRTFNTAYPFFGLCLFSASVHSTDDTTFFWGFCVLTAWALWPHRSPRFALALWTAVLALVVVLSYFGQRGIGQFQSYLGNLNPQWLGAFARRRFDPTQSQTEIGTLGRIKTSPRIIIRVEAPSGVPPRRLREATYRAFKNRTWYSEFTENDFSRVSETNDTTFQLFDKPVPETVRISCYVPGGKALLPLPRGVGRLENLLAYNVWKNPLGAVLEEGPGLVVFDALYGPGPSMDSPAEDVDLTLPERDMPALEQVVDELHLQGQTIDQALQTLSRFFSTQFTYSTWFEQDRSSHRSEPPLTRFLLHTRSGHCEYFATAAAVLLRKIGIPTRYAVGYAVHEGDGKNWVVRQRDGHAWTLVWDDRHKTWREFDPTPAAWVSMDARQITLMQRISDLWARVTFEISKFRWGQSHVRDYLLLGSVPILLLLFYQVFFRRRRRRSIQRGTNSRSIDWPGFDSEFYQLERKLAVLGLSRHPSEPVSMWIERISEHESVSEIQGSLRELLALHYRYRFDPLGLSAADRRKLQSLAGSCLEKLEERSVPEPVSR